MNYAIVNVPVATVYGDRAETRRDENGRLLSNCTDEGLYGSVCRVLEADGLWRRIQSHYGYIGYVHAEDLLELPAAQAERWLASALRMVDAPCLDLRAAPTVHGAPLLSLPSGALVEVLPAQSGGWQAVGLADGREGWAPAQALAEKRFTEEWLTADPAELCERMSQAGALSRSEPGGSESFSFSALLRRCYQGDEGAFRRRLVSEAQKYLGTQYRWGGRSSFGIDCSGLVSMSYMKAGVNIYRDASLVRGFPLKRLPLTWEADGRFSLHNLDSGALLPGDALFFPGHIALYLGEGRYIHSTGRAGDMGVVINSLRPEAEDFREDLLRSLYAAGGLRTECEEL